MTESGDFSHLEEKKRHATEKAFGESEETFKLLVSAVRDYAIFALDPKGHILTWNSGAEHLKGYTADEIIGSHFSIFYTDEDVARKHPDEELRLAVSEGVYQEEGWRVKKDGSRFWANVVITTLLDSNGNVRGFAKVTRDLTEKKLAEEKLLQSEEKLRKANELLEAKVAERTTQLMDLNRTLSFERGQLETIFQLSPAAMVLWTGPDFVFEKINPQYQAIFPDRVLQGKPFLEACPEFIGQPFLDLLTRVFETGEPFVGREVLARHADVYGGPLVDHYYDFTYMRVTDANGNPYGVYDHAVDVTDKVRAREAIQNQSRWLEEVLNRLPIGLIMADPDTANYHFINHAARTMLGQAPQEARLELRPDKLIVKDINERILSAEETPSARAARGEELVNEVIILEKIGSRIFVSCNSNIIPSMPGHNETVLIPFVDISELKMKELELRRAVEELEDKKEKLLTTVQELEQERELRERFVATLTHDLRTPLTAAKMSAQLVRRKLGENEALQKLASKINDNIDRADEMIRDLLDANSIRAGETLPIELASCNLDEVIVETIDELGTVYGNRFILTSDQSINGFWSISGLRRILENLCVNAIKYGAPLRPVRISLSSTLDSVTIEVRNEGHPIAPEDQVNLFQPFHRTSSARAGGQKGWGLGLTLVKGIAEAHGGSVAVQSAEETGTVFKVILPKDSRGLKKLTKLKQNETPTV